MNKLQASGMLVAIWFLFLILNIIAQFTDNEAEGSSGEKILAAVIHTSQIQCFRSSTYKFMNIAFNGTFALINQLLHELIMAGILFYVVAKTLATH